MASDIAAPTTIMSTEKEKTKERYYIYSHIKKVDNDEETSINNQIIDENAGTDDKIRKARSSSSADRKQVSRNISLVLENLLMSYENSQLPTHGEGLLLCFLKKIIEFAFELNFIYFCYVCLILYWIFPCLFLFCLQLMML